MKYIDCFKGDDSNDGSLTKPWQSFSKITNNSKIILLSHFNTELNLNNLSDVRITGTVIDPIQLQSATYPIPNYTPKFTKLNIMKPLYQIKENPTMTDVGSINKINIDKTTNIDNEYINKRKYTVGGVISINLINCTNVIIEGVSVSPIFNTNFICHVHLKRGIRLKNCVNCVVRNSELFSEKAIDGWSKVKIDENIFNVVITEGMGNRIVNNNIYNCGGIQVLSTDNIIHNNLITNYPRDGIRIMANNNLCCNNMVLNSKLTKNKGDDMLKIQGSNIYLFNNAFIAYNNYSNEYVNTSLDGITINSSDTTPNDSIFIKNNMIYNDTLVGINAPNLTNSIIDKNTVVSCNPDLDDSLKSIIKLTGKNNIITNNIAWKLIYIYNSSDSDNGSNVLLNNYSLETNNFI